jgi:monofunctional biosynthetic peptidoglycan transglycosylase
MNVAEMGDGIFGIEKASQKYFNRSAANLSRQEASMIAACLPNPRRYSVKPVSRYVSVRSGWILRQMNNLQADPDIQKIVNNTPSKK